MVNNKFLLGCGIAIASIAGYVALAMSGNEDLEAARGVFLFSAPFITILLGSGAYDAVRDKQEETAQNVNVIKHNTNGVLSAKIEKAAIDAADLAVTRHAELLGKINSDESGKE